MVGTGGGPLRWLVLAARRRRWSSWRVAGAPASSARWSAAGSTTRTASRSRARQRDRRRGRVARTPTCSCSTPAARQRSTTRPSGTRSPRPLDRAARSGPRSPASCPTTTRSAPGSGLDRPARHLRRDHSCAHGGDDGKLAALDAIRPALAAPGLHTEVGGLVAVHRDANTQIDDGHRPGRDATRMPLLLILLIFIFRGVVAAATPLLVGVLAILGAFTATRAARARHRRLDLRRQHHHAARPGHGHRLRAVRGQPVPRGAGAPATTGRGASRAPWPPPAAPSLSPGSPWRSRWPAC